LEVRARELSAALKSPRRVETFAVMLPEPLPDRETERLLGELQRLGLSADTVFLNRVLLPEQTSECQRCKRAAQWQAPILASLKQRFRGKAVYAIRNFDHEFAGKRGLRELTGELWRLN
jgi:anion-transporting  ArsA/GET3 family ATPase